MPDNLRRYTVSAVVNTDTGELVGTPIIRPGHENYDSFGTVKPLADAEQFRWVHVWAPNEDAAAADEALTADLRSGGDRSRPVARALTGAAGLKPYGVAAVVDTGTGRPIGEPIVAEGHHAMAGATFVDRRGTRVRTANVWARDRADAVEQVFSTGPEARHVDQPRAVGSARGDPDAPGRDGGKDFAPAQREWSRIAGMPVATRAELVADTVWTREYPAAYRTTYTTAASRIAAAATEAAAANPGAWPTLHQLAAAAGDAISGLAPGHPAAPPADQHAVAAARTAAAAPGRLPPWQRVAELAADRARTAGALDGIVTATADILAGWRGRSGHAMAEDVVVQGRPAREWVAALLATVSRDTAAPVTVAAGRTAAQLAREDRAPGVTPMTADATSSRTRPAAPSAPASTPTRRMR
jgi:hypothetical protein